jgi:hypothetical protein
MSNGSTTISSMIMTNASGVSLAAMMHDGLQGQDAFVVEAAEAAYNALVEAGKTLESFQVAFQQYEEGQIPVLPDPEYPYPKHPAEPAPELRVYINFDGPDGSENVSNLTDAYAVLQPGGAIYLDEADYSRFNFNRDFATPVQIRSRVPYAATVKDRWFFHEGHGHWLYNVTVDVPASKLGAEKGAIVHNSDFIATYNIVKSVCGVYGIASTNPDDPGSSAGKFSQASNFWIGFNDFVGQNSVAMNSACQLKLRCYDGNTPTAGTPEFAYFGVYDNWFEDPSDGNNADGVEETFNLYLGNTKPIYPDSYCYPGIITRNLSGPKNKRRFIYLKRAIEDVTYNHCQKARYSAFTQRHGWGSKWWGNRNDDPNANCIFGGGRLPSPYPAAEQNDIRGLVTAGEVQIRCGSQGNGGKPLHQGCDYGLMVGNMVAKQTILGAIASSSHTLAESEGGKLSNFTLYEHQGPISVVDKYCDGATLDVQPGKVNHGMFVPVTITLTREMVGIKG